MNHDIIIELHLKDAGATNLAAAIGIVEGRLEPYSSPEAIDSAIAVLRQEAPELFRPELPELPEPPRPVAAPVPTGFRAPRTAEQREADAINRATAAGNPWAATSLSVTRQIFLEAADPALAAQLRAEAGVR